MRVVKRTLVYLMILCLVVGNINVIPADAAKKTVKATAVTLNKTSYTLKKGKSVTLKATVKPKNAANKSLVWSSSNKKVATVSQKGKVTAKKNGKATITVKIKNNKKLKATCSITVGTPVSKVSVKSSKVSLYVGDSYQIKTTVTPSKATNKKVSYSSSNKKVATVDSKGKIKAKAAGSATITVKAKDGTGKKAAVKVTVKKKTLVTKVSVTASKKVLTVGETLTLKAAVSPKNATNKAVSWSSSNKKIATVDSKGKVKAKAAGTVTITAQAKDSSKKKGSVKLTIKKKEVSVTEVALVSGQTELTVGDELTITAKVKPDNATNKKLSWSSSDTKIATVSGEGKVTAVSAGSVTITAKASDGSNKSGKIKLTIKEKVIPVNSITLDEPSVEMKAGDTKQLEPKVLPVTATNRNVVYRSSDDKVASVDEKGLVTAVAPGTAKITVEAADGSGVRAEVDITVKAYLRGLELVSEFQVVNTGKTLEIEAKPVPSSATVASIQYTSSAPENATVTKEGNKGIVTGIKNGMVTIIAEATDPDGNKASGEISITVGTAVTGLSINAEKCSLFAGQEKQLIPTVQPPTANRQGVEYSSSDESVASVSVSGLITAKSAGSADITVKTVDGGFEKVCQVTVTNPAAEVKVSTQDELDQALKKSDLQILTIEGDGDLQLNIPEGSYENTVLKVNAPKAHIENHASFQNVAIQAIGSSTFVEYAIGNEIYYAAQSGTVQIAEGAVSSVTVLPGAKELALVNDGSVSSMVVGTAANLDIKGASENEISVTVTSEAQDAVIKTNKSLVIQADAAMKLELSSGAENTVMTVSDETKLPTVSGLGSVPVTILSNGNLETVVGENTGEEQQQKVKVSGSIVSGSAPVDGAKIYLIPYSAGIDKDNISSKLDQTAANTVSDSEGKYLTEQVSIGNYYLFVQKDGYQDVLETVVLTSANNEIWNAALIRMVAAGEAAVGSLHGTIYDAETGKPVPDGITLKIRSGRNNLSGDPLYITETDKDGGYRFSDLPVGQYTIQVIDERNSEEGSYITTSFSAVVGEGEGNIQNGTITLILASDEVRFVLTWGDEESGASSDLDSHLIGPKAGGIGQFHTWYSDKTYYDRTENGEGIRYADLDVDDTEYEGPETSTIYVKTDGIYHFYVHDCVNEQSSDSTLLGRSSAVVKVSIGAKTVAEYNVPNEPGNLWHVCDYDSTTGKVTQVNKMSHWTESLSFIGMDMLGYYKDNLQNNISVIESMKAGFSNAEEWNKAEEMLAEARKVLETSQEWKKLQAKAQVLDEWIAQCLQAVSINELYGDDITRWYYEYYEDEENIYEQNRTLVIEGYQETLPELTVYVPDGSTYKIEDSDRDSGSKMIVVTAPNSYTRKYHISYSLSSNICKVGSVSAIENGQELIAQNEWYTDTWSDRDDNEFDVLYIFGYVETLPSNLTIKGENEKATVNLKDSDKTGYDKMVTLSYLSASRTYYIKYQISRGVCEIGSVSAIKDGLELIVQNECYTDIEWNEDHDEFYVLYIKGYAETLPSNLTIQGVGEKAAVSLKDSDKTGYDKMVTLSYLSVSKTYYIKYQISGNLCEIGSISAIKDGQELIVQDGWYTSTGWDEKDNEFDVLYIRGYAETLPSNLTIKAVNERVTVNLKDSDRTGYDKMVTLSYQETLRTYYIFYKYDGSAWDVGPVSATENGQELIAQDECETGIEWEDDDNKFYVLYIYGYVETLPSNLTIKGVDEKVAVDLKDSDKTGYDKMVTLSYLGISRTYYIKYQSSSAICRIGSISATRDGQELIAQDEWYTYTEWEEGDNEFDVLHIYGYTETLPSNLTIKGVDEKVAVDLKDSDKTGYDKMVTLSYLGVSSMYYIKYQSSRYICEIGSVSATENGQELIMEDEWYTDIERDEGDNEFDVLYINGYAKTLPSNLIIKGVDEKVTVDLKDSDKTGYDKMVTVSYLDVSRTYYIKYAFTEAACGVDSVSAIIDGEDVIETWSTHVDDEGEFYILELWGYSTNLPDNLVIKPKYSAATVEFRESDKTGYEKIVVISCNGVIYSYYIKYNYY